MKSEYPIFDICNLVANSLSTDFFNIDRFSVYIDNNPHINAIHKHSFYHFALFTSGKGRHLLDFEDYPIKEGVIYFMRPHQIHEWIFEEKVEGYIVNFSDVFFDQLAVGASILEYFPFFNLLPFNQVIELDKEEMEKVILLFEQILGEVKSPKKQQHTVLMIMSLLFQIFVLSSRNKKDVAISHMPGHHNAILIKRFIVLIEQKFREVRLPKEYAHLLNITSSHLNHVCQEQTQMPAGEIIRKRVLLEAKRLLVNFELTVSDVAFNLNFFDTSYFVKFFKKHTGLTPEVFRKQYYNQADFSASKSTN